MSPYIRIYTLLSIITPSALFAQDVANLDFNYTHGTVINNQYAALGITISVNGGQNIGIVYDSELGGDNGGLIGLLDGHDIDGADNDLERLSSAGNPNDWDGGNLGANYNAGGLLIIQENVAQTLAPTFGSGLNLITSASLFNPDDNAGGGTITFDIDDANFTYNYFNVTLADFEEDGANYSTKLYGVNGAEEVFSFSDFTNPSHARYDPSIVGGDNHINALPEISLSSGEALRKVDITFNNSSGSVSNIVFSKNPVPVPEPASISLLGFGTLALLMGRQR